MFLKELFELLFEVNKCVEVWIGCFDDNVNITFVRCFSGGARPEYSYAADAMFVFPRVDSLKPSLFPLFLTLSGYQLFEFQRKVIF